MLTEGTGLAVVAITGMGGVGKTALALQAAHAVADEYPDGQVYLDLQGYGSDAPRSPLDGLDYLLRAFGLSGRDIPLKVDEAAARLRTLLAGRRVLIVLDNAGNATQVKPLLPGMGSSAVLVTSRHDLSGIPTARILRVGLLSRLDGLEVLRTTLDSTRVDPDPEARPHWPLTYLADLLQDERRRLDQLRHDELGVRASFDVSIDALAGSESPMSNGPRRRSRCSAYRSCLI